MSPNLDTAPTASTPSIDDPDSSESACCGGATQWIDHDDAEELARRLGALADPIRLQVVSVIANAPDGEVCACDFGEPLGRSQPTISHHLKVLTEAGVIEGDRRGRWIWYRLSEESVDQLATSLSGLASGQV